MKSMLAMAAVAAFVLVGFARPAPAAPLHAAASAHHHATAHRKVTAVKARKGGSHKASRKSHKKRA